MIRGLARGVWLACAASVVLSCRVAGAAPEALLRPSAAAEQRYADAIEALRRGDAARALEGLAAADDRSVVGDHVRYFSAEALLRSDPAAASRVAESVAEQSESRPLGRPALLLAAFAAARAGDESRNGALLRRFLARYPDAPETPLAMYGLGESLEAQGQPEDAVRTYRDLTLVAPASDYADGAMDRLEVLRAAGVTLGEPSPEDRLRRADRLLRGGLVDQARAEADAVLAGATERDLVLRALAVVAAALGRARRHEAAAGVMERALAVAPDEGKPALGLERARLLYRAGKNEQALLALDRIGDFREPETAEATYLKGVLQEEGKLFAAAALAYEEVATRYPRHDVAARSLWRLGWLAYLEGDHSRAAAQWARLAALPAGGRFRLAATYWRGRVQEALGAGAEAARLFERVQAEAPRGYYGILATRRLAGAPVRDDGDPPLRLPGDPVLLLAGDADYERIEILRRLGLPEYAAAEMDDMTLRSLADPVKLYWLSAAYQRQERFDLSLRIVRRHFGDITTSGHPGLPRAFWELAYPIGWQTELLGAAARAGVDPFLIAAVVREESSFYPLARSRAGARGLMQLLPQTARGMAARRGLVFGNGELLDEPGPNLRLGAAMLADLTREFTDPRLAIAAYNAGPGRVREWWAARRSSDLEAFVEQIPYEETRLYVKRVIVSWAEYRRLYADGASP